MERGDAALISAEELSFIVMAGQKREASVPVVARLDRAIPYSRA
jgi:hypothetical protein